MTWSGVLETGAVAIVSAAIGVGGTIWAASLDFKVKDRELDIRMVDVALTILSAKDVGTKSPYAKRYALRLLSKYGGEPIPDDEQKNWSSDSGELPVGIWPAYKTPGTLDLQKVLQDSGYITPDRLK